MRYIRRGNETWPLRVYWGRRRWVLGRLTCLGNIAYDEPYLTGWELDQVKRIKNLIDELLERSEASYQELKDLYVLPEKDPDHHYGAQKTKEQSHKEA